jgi:hypothetical protein
VGRTFAPASGVRLEALIEAFNLTNRANPLTRNANFGPGSYPTNPAATFDQITAVGDPRSVQLDLRLTFRCGRVPTDVGHSCRAHPILSNFTASRAGARASAATM